jgi:hypothetical protein
VNLRPYCPWRARTLPVLKTGEIKVYHMEEGNEFSISHIEHSGVASIFSVVGGVSGVNLRL